MSPLTHLKNALQHHFTEVDWNLNAGLSFLRRRWQVIGLTALVIVALSMGVVWLMPAQYTAQTLLQINTRHEQVTNLSDVVSGMVAGDAAIRTEMDVLRSRKLAARVIDKLNLLSKAPELNNSGWFINVHLAVRYFLLPNRQTAIPTIESSITRAVNVFLSRLKVVMLPRSYSINVSYTSRDPLLASAIANAVALEYLNSQLEDKFEATRRANAWMSTRLKELQTKVFDAELAEQKFREAHNLTQARGVTLNEQQLSELNSQLILARTQLAEAEAKLSQAQQMASKGRGIETTSEVLNSPLIQNLRMQETEVRRKLSDLASRYGDKHPRIRTVRHELADVQRKIGEETLKIQGSLANDVGVAQARVQTLDQQLDDLQRKAMNGNIDIQLAEFQRQAQAERNLYENFLTRSKEIAQMDFAQTDARVISKAETPLTPSVPNKPLILILSLSLGLLLGVALAWLLDLLDSGFRTSQQLEATTHISAMGALGELAIEEKELSRYVINKPTSAFAEGLRAIRANLDFAMPDKRPQVILLTSSVPNEGKSLLSLSLGQISALGGQKTLLLEADLRRPTIAKHLGLKPKAGLAELLTQNLKFKDIVLEQKNSGLHILPALSNNAFASELLGSDKMKKLLTELRKTYHTILIDSPPVIAVADATVVSSLVDSILFVVRWGATPRTLAAHAIKALKAAHAPVTGSVLTRVDFEKQAAYGHDDYGYYYGKYKDYYTD